LSRSIDDALQGQVMHSAGEAEFQPGATGLIYDEELLVQVPGQNPMKGTRRYLWQATPDGIAVSFDDGRYFHSFSLGGPRAAADHDCPPDFYSVIYNFAAWPLWRATWKVSGPRKSYEMRTEYTPL